MTWGPREKISMALLVFMGMIFAGLSLAAMITDHDALSGTFGFLTLLGFVLAALAPRMQGRVQAGLQGISFELAREAREVVDEGRRAGDPNEVVLESLRKAIEAALESGRSGRGDSTGPPEGAPGDDPPAADGAPTAVRGTRRDDGTWLAERSDDLLDRARRSLARDAFAPPANHDGAR